MSNILYVFKSRNESVAFFDMLKKMGICALIVNTPRECMTGCGISVETDISNMARSRQILTAFPYKSTFIGCYSVDKLGIRKIVHKLF